MESKQRALMVSSKVISVIMKIGFIAMIVALCLCAASLVFIAATDGQTEAVTLGGINLRIVDDLGANPGEAVVLYAVYAVMSAFLLVIFMMAGKMFAQISRTGDPFREGYGKTVRIVGVLVAAMTFGTGLADFIASVIAKTCGAQTYSEAPGIAVGAIIFCLSYIIDYGCALKRRVGDSE